MKELELYIHIPFCVKKCKYCDFLSAPADEQERLEYVERLCVDIRSFSESVRDYRVVSIFLGGGTPSILEPEQTRSILDEIYGAFQVDEDAEITTEMNPGAVTEEKLKVYKETGINRLSIGLQSAEERELKALGRIHTYEEFLDSYRKARAAGFTNINVDLMSAIPYQTLESYERSLRKIAELGAEHISAYSLIIEEETPFYDRYAGGKHSWELPDEDTERLMYTRTEEILEGYGYRRYEISNYAKEGYECRHNLGYWDRREYLGIGAGAASFMDHCRWTWGEEPEKLSPSEEMEEFMFLGLRKMEGISVEKFQEYFDKDIEKVYGEIIKDLCGQNLLERNGKNLRLTRRGIDLSNYVMSQFLFG